MNEWMQQGQDQSVKSFVRCFEIVYLTFQTGNSLLLTMGPFEVAELSPVDSETKANLPSVPSVSHQITTWQQYTKWISTCKAVVHTVCVMKSMIESWEVNAFHCKSETLSSHFLCPHQPVYQKYVCCYCVHTISVTMTFSYIESPKVPLSYWQ